MAFDQGKLMSVSNCRHSMEATIRRQCTARSNRKTTLDAPCIHFGGRPVILERTSLYLKSQKLAAQGPSPGTNGLRLRSPAGGSGADI